MNVDVEELRDAVQWLEDYLYDDAKLSDKKIEKIHNILSDILYELDDEMD